MNQHQNMCENLSSLICFMGLIQKYHGSKGSREYKVEGVVLGNLASHANLEESASHHIRHEQNISNSGHLLVGKDGCEALSSIGNMGHETRYGRPETIETEDNNNQNCRRETGGKRQKTQEA